MPERGAQRWLPGRFPRQRRRRRFRSRACATNCAHRPFVHIDILIHVDVLIDLVVLVDLDILVDLEVFIHFVSFGCGLGGESTNGGN